MKKRVLILMLTLAMVLMCIQAASVYADVQFDGEAVWVYDSSGEVIGQYDTMAEAAEKHFASGGDGEIIEFHGDTSETKETCINKNVTFTSEKDEQGNFVHHTVTAVNENPSLIKSEDARTFIIDGDLTFDGNKKVEQVINCYVWGKTDLLRINNCEITGATGAGLYIDSLGSAHYVLTDTICHDNGEFGAKIGQWDITVEDCEFYNNTGDGILIDTGRHEPFFVKNIKCYNNGGNGCNLFVPFGTLEGGEFTNNGLNGIYSNAISGETLTISDAKISGNGVSGICFDDAGYNPRTVIISGNTITGNKEHGVYMNMLGDRAVLGISGTNVFGSDDEIYIAVPGRVIYKKGTLAGEAASIPVAAVDEAAGRDILVSPDADHVVTADDAALFYSYSGEYGVKYNAEGCDDAEAAVKNVAEFAICKKVTYNAPDGDDDKELDETVETVPYGESVRIDPNGGIWRSSTEARMIKIEADETVEDPERDGYIFMGWLKEKEDGCEFSLIADWEADENGNSVPDKYEAAVTFKVENGKWDDETTEDKTVYVTLFDKNGKMSETGKGKLTADQIPAAGNKPNSGYKKGAWNVEPTTELEISTDTDFAYTFVKESTGGGGGDTPAPLLNTKDHFSYIVGYGDGSVKPEGNITRAETATIFFRLLSDDVRKQFWTTENGYSDVAADAWYNNAISTLSNMGILEGYSDGTFRPNAAVTRAQFAKIAVSFFEYVNEEYDGKFDDITGDEWFAEYIQAAYEQGLIEGFGDGSFKPDMAITRAQACTIVNRTLERKPDKDHLLKLKEMVTWSDLDEDAWYYADMMEATNSHDYKMIKVDGEKVEEWTKKLPQRDWEAFENEWSTANSAKGGEVVDK